MIVVKYCLLFFILIVSSSANDIEDYDFEVFEAEMAAARARARARAVTTSTPNPNVSFAEKTILDDVDETLYDSYYQGKNI